MKEIKLVTNITWLAVAMVVSALIIAGSAVFITLQYNKTQLDIANLQKDAQIESSNNIKSGLNEVGSGICKVSDKSMLFC